MAGKFEDKNKNNRNSDDMDAFFAAFEEASTGRTSRQSPSSRTASKQKPGAKQTSRPASGQQTGAHRTSHSSSGQQAGAHRASHSSSDQRAGAHRASHNSSASSGAESKPQHGSRKKDAGTAASAKNKKKNRKPKSRAKRIFFTLLAIIVACILIGIIYVAVVVVRAAPIDPDNIYNELSQRSTIYDDRGKQLEIVSASGGNRDNVQYDDLPEDLTNAIVAIEDKTFWDHHGFNFVRMLGAIKDSVFSSGRISGTSTLTQQLARNVYLANIKSERSLSRKITEAYYTVLLENHLSKEQILEAYLNTIYLGFDSYGVEAASQAYFGKSVTRLDLQECAALAALPQSPDASALVKSYSTDSDVDIDKSNLLKTTDSMYYVYNGDFSANRRNLTLENMVDQGYITASEKKEAQDANLKEKLKISVDQGSEIASYFTDYAIEQIAEDIMEEFGSTKAEARSMVYTGGLKIYTTLDSNMQKTVEKSFSENYNFPGVTNLRRDSEGNILNQQGKIILYDYDDYFDDNNNFILKSDEFKRNSDGSMTIYRNKRLNLFKTEVNGGLDVSIEFKPMYLWKDNVFHTIENGVLSIPQEYKTVDASDNCTISAEFFNKYPDFFVTRGNDLQISEKNYLLKQAVVQPQSAMVILDNETGAIKAMVGGRKTEGKQLYNRADKPRQPGSSIKPIAVYSAALQKSYEAAEKGDGMALTSQNGDNWGSYITAGSVINDAPMVVNGRTWPKNWYNGYRGRMTLRTAVQQSVNVCAVKTYQQVGSEYSMNQLKRMGVTTLKEDGSVNDMNPAALALGGMSYGISPLEMAAAYATFPNQGIYTEPSTYTKIENSNDEVIMLKKPQTEQVLDPGVAFIMTDILRSVVTNGLGSPAAIGSQPVGGKTGTTTDNFDAWFVGFTPQYSAALWVGNDVNIELTTGSTASARLWGSIMSQVCAGTTYESFSKAPDNVTYRNGEYYVEGTYSHVSRPGSSKSSTKSTTETTTAPTTTAPTTQQTTTTAPPTTQQTTTTAPPTTQQTTTTAPPAPSEPSDGVQPVEPPDDSDGGNDA